MTVTSYTEDNVFFKEHNYTSGGSWQNWETCIADMGEDCPLCDDGMRSSYVAVFTIIDLSEFTTKKDSIKVTASKKLFVLKGLTIKKFLKKRDAQEGNIKFCKFNTARYEAKEASTGTDFEFKERLTEAGVAALRQLTSPYSMEPDEWLQPYDYMKLFAPKSADTLRRIIGSPAPTGSAGDVASNIVSASLETGPVPDDDIPF